MFGIEKFYPTEDLCKHLYKTEDSKHIFNVPINYKKLQGNI